MADQVVVSENALGYLNATRPWVKFLAILGFIGIAFMVLFGLLMIFGFSLLPTQSGAPAFGAVFGVFYFLFAILYFMPCLFLYRYSKAIAAIPGTGPGALEEALKNQKSFWKFMGVLALILLSIELLVVVIGVLVAVARHH